jgi:putative lipoprotein
MRGKRSTLWASALVIAVLLALAAFRGCSLPDGRPIAGAVLEQAPLPLPPAGPGAALEGLQREVRGAPERAREAAPRERPDAAAQTAAAPAADGSRRFMFDCGNGVFFAVRTVSGEATLFSPQALGNEVITLPQSEAASGARYAAGDVVFSSKGGLATFEIRERTFADCTSNPGGATTAEARRRGVTFRALGNEPPWVLEISPQALTVTTEYGAKRTEFPHREPTIAATRTTYRSFLGLQELVVTIDPMPCNDTMSGEPFDNTVALTYEGTTLYGCGRTP